MANKPQPNKLDALRNLLRNLRTQAPSPNLEPDLKAVDQYLNDLDHDLQANKDQVRLAALYQVSQALSTSLDLDEVLAKVMDAVIGFTKAERGFLVLLEPETGAWELRAARNFNQQDLPAREVEVSRTVINTVLESAQGLVTTDAQTDPRFSEHESVVFYALRSIMCAPLLSRGQIIGAIYVDNRAQIGNFRPSDLEMLSSLAVQSAIAIDNARMYTRTDQALARRVAELETLGQVDRELNALLDLHHAMEITHRWITQEAKASQAQVVFAEDGNLEGEVITYPEGFTGFKDPFVRRSISEMKAVNLVPAEGQSARLVIPIIHSSKLLGVVQVERSELFD